jgi:hypothetical protein
MLGGRKAWIAWPIGVLSVAAVAALVVIAVPGIPTVVEFVTGALRQGASANEANTHVTQKPLAKIGTAMTDDCSSLYPPSLWLELSLPTHTVLSQTMAGPPTSATAVVAAAKPTVRMTCSWRDGAGATVTTTLADVDAAAQPIVTSGLSGQGFGCRPSGDGILCTRTVGAALETDVVRGGVWLSTLEQGWHPTGYTQRLIARLWP